ncbi:MAG: DUF805 domain-containing protein [Serratia sp.]|nr:DUF805 domain-containing protein [Serratia sp. (in: enterobacteria)]
MNWYLKVLKNYTFFSGRAPRSEYWWFSMFNFLISIALSLIASLLGDEYVISGLYSLFIFLPGLAVTIRRIHDAGYSGWWVLCPIFNLIVLFFASEDDNRFGLRPADIAR